MADAARISWARFGKRITFYLPGMFSLYGERGCYPAVSVTGRSCELMCRHCRGKLLESMVPAPTAQALLKLAERWRELGVRGVLLSGGSTREGFVPLEPLLPAVPELKKMGFVVTAHTGFATEDLARAVADAGIDHVLVDVVGDDRTVREVLNLPQGVAVVERALEALAKAKVTFVPHIIVGLGGGLTGELEALAMLEEFSFPVLTYVVLMPAVALAHEAKAQGEPPPKPVPLEDVLRVMVVGRRLFPEIEHALGCARPRGEYRYALERWSIRAGVNRMALWSEAAVDEAKRLGLEVIYCRTCCSVSPEVAGWTCKR